MTFSLQVLPPFFLLSPGLITLVEIPAKVLDFFLLFPENLTKLVSGVTHVLEHQTELIHRLSCLIENLSSGRVVQVQLVDLLAEDVDFPLVLLNFLKCVLSLQLCCPSFLVHDVDSLLFSPNLPIDIFYLAT